MARGAVLLSLAIAVLLAVTVVVASSAVPAEELQQETEPASPARDAEVAEPAEASQVGNAVEDGDKPRKSVTTTYQRAGLTAKSGALLAGSLAAFFGSFLAAPKTRVLTREVAPRLVVASGLKIASIALMAASLYQVFKKVPVKSKQKKTEVQEAPVQEESPGQEQPSEQHQEFSGQEGLPRDVPAEGFSEPDFSERGFPGQDEPLEQGLAGQEDLNVNGANP